MVISSSDLETAIDTEISAPTVLTQPVFKPVFFSPSIGHNTMIYIGPFWSLDVLTDPIDLTYALIHSAMVVLESVIRREA